MKIEDKKMYTTQEAAQLLNVNDSYLRQLVAAGKATAVKFADRWMWTASEIERLHTRPKSKGGRPKKQ